MKSRKVYFYYSELFTDARVNLLLAGHMGKVTLAYQNRPVFNANEDLLQRKGAFLLQFQANFN